MRILTGKFTKTIAIYTVTICISLMPTLSIFAEAAQNQTPPEAPVEPPAPVAPQPPEEPIYSEPGQEPQQTQQSSDAANPTVSVPENAANSQSEDQAQENQDLKVSNDTTGADSENNAEVNTNSDTDITNSNDADIKNDIWGNASTGNNEANYNTGNGSVQSGDSDVFLNILNFINTIFYQVPKDGIKLILENIFGSFNGNYVVDPATGEAYTITGARTEITNSNSGNNSDNDAALNAQNNTTITNSNEGMLDNDIDLSSSTGKNTASYNTGNGSISTGDANISLNLINFMNSSISAVESGVFGILNIFGSWNGDLVLPTFMGGLSGPVNYVILNSATGANSLNNGTLNSESDVDINNDNEAEISNNIDATGNTGGNSSNYNTGGGNIDTGNTKASLGLTNIANTNIYGDNVCFIYVNALDGWQGSNLLASNPNNLASIPLSTLLLGNNNTGSDSNNNAVANLDNSEEINNDNDGTLDNDISLNANTGNNAASYNTGSGSINTGDANILANIVNFMNTNISSKRFMFFFVNVFGTWKGNIRANNGAETGGAHENMPDNTNNSNQLWNGGGYGGHTTQKRTYNNSISNSQTGEDKGDENNSLVPGGTLASGSNSSNTNEDKKTEEGSFLDRYGKNILSSSLILYLASLSVQRVRKKRKL